MIDLHKVLNYFDGFEQITTIKDESLGYVRIIILLVIIVLLKQT